MRAFVAISVPEDIKQALVHISAELRRSNAKASWVKPENMHLTLRFLGEIEGKKAIEAGDFMRPAYAAKSPFPLCVRGLGAFPKLSRPSVVWAGLAPIDPLLLPVQRIAEDAARHIGVKPENTPFHPHLTLARIRDGRRLGDLRERVEREQDFDAGDFVVRGVSLWRSELTPQGPRYDCVETFPLAGDTREHDGKAS